MLLRELFEDSKKPNLIEIFRKFFPLAMKEIGLKDLPEIELVDRVQDRLQPTFGKFVNDTNTIYLGILNRHPLDILRTLAHELVHYKQNTEHRLDATSGHTGSPAENEAHEIAGIVMRHFNKMHPEYFDDLPIMTEGWKDDLKRSAKRAAIGAAAMGAIGAGIAGYDISQRGKHPEPSVQQQQQLIPSDDNDDYNILPPDIKQSSVPDVEVPKTPKADTLDAKMPAVNYSTPQTPLTPQFFKKYVEAQKLVQLPTPEANDLKNAAIKAGIVGPELDQFLGQWAHESGNFTQFDEMYRSDGSVKHSKQWLVDHYWKNKTVRGWLGNKTPDDAWRYRGRGFCQLTGRDNYQNAGRDLGINLIDYPALASHPKYMVPIAIWYWQHRVSNKVSAAHMNDTTAVTRAINHGESKENIQKRHSWVQSFRNLFKKGT